MHALIRISMAIERLVSGIGHVGSWIVLPLIAVTLFDVVARRFFDVGSSRLQELEWHFHTALFCLCLGFTYLRNGHVRVDLWREGQSVQTKYWVELVGCLVFLIPYTLVLFYFGVRFAYRSFAIDEVSIWAHGLTHRWIIKSFLPIAAALWFLAGVSVVLQRVVLLFGPSGMRERYAQLALETHHRARDRVST